MKAIQVGEQTFQTWIYLAALNITSECTWCAALWWKHLSLVPMFLSVKAHVWHSQCLLTMSKASLTLITQKMWKQKTTSACFVNWSGGYGLCHWILNLRAVPTSLIPVPAVWYHIRYEAVGPFCACVLSQAPNWTAMINRLILKLHYLSSTTFATLLLRALFSYWNIFYIKLGFHQVK